MRITIVLLILATVALHAQGPESRAEAKIDQVYAQHKLSGEGVLTIMMDRGIDWLHPDFRNADGSTRIAYIFDLLDDTGATEPDNPYGLGTIWNEQEINDAIAGTGPLPFRDIGGHGTATTGIMCGNGTAIADHERFRGVAYNSKIIVIVSFIDGRPAFGDNPAEPGKQASNRREEAFQFAKDKSIELDMPSVMLLNAGSIFTPTDGQGSYCRMINNYLGEGRLYVCGVGDDGGSDNHAAGSFELGTDLELKIQKGEEGFANVMLWYSEDDRFDLTIVKPDGSTIGPIASVTASTDSYGENFDELRVTQEGADIEFTGSTADHRYLRFIVNSGTGEFTLRITPTQVNSDGEFHAYLNPSRLNNGNKFTTFVSKGGSIHEFSACPSVISPSDHVSNNVWTDIDNVTRTGTTGNPGEIWLGSSEGPTMDGRLGVDFSSPGEMNFGAYSQDSYYGTFRFNLAQGGEGYYGRQSAVSGSAPLATGVIALMLEVNPNLTQEEAKSILQQTARSDQFTGQTPNITWGYGKLDALAAIDALLSTTTKDVPAELRAVSISPNPTNDHLRIDGLPDEVRIETVDLVSILGKRTHSWHTHVQSYNIPSKINQGMYILRVHTDAGTVAKKVLIY